MDRLLGWQTTDGQATLPAARHPNQSLSSCFAPQLPAPQGVTLPRQRRHPGGALAPAPTPPLMVVCVCAAPPWLHVQAALEHVVAVCRAKGVTPGNFAVTEQKAQVCEVWLAACGAGV